MGSGSKQRRVKVTVVDDIFTGATGVPGEISYTTNAGSDDIAGLLFRCPCGCGVVSGVTFKNGPLEAGPEWSWDGDEESPTVKPSIRRVGVGCNYHGFLTDGRFTFC